MCPICFAAICFDSNCPIPDSRPMQLEDTENVSTPGVDNRSEGDTTETEGLRG